MNPESDFLAGTGWHDCVFGGTWHRSSGGVAPVREPANHRTLGTTGIADALDVAEAGRAAAAAQPGWAATGARERAAVLRGAAACLERHAQAWAELVARETGAILPKGQHELREAVAILHAAAALALQPCGELLPSPPERLSYARRVPRGVIGVISPFNFPLILSMRAVAPALALGNAVILKPDVQTPLSGGFMIARAFEEAGLPLGLLHVLPGGALPGEALCSDPQVSMIQFTGSTAIGRRVAELAGRHLKRVSLELGGNNALIVLEDADLDAAVNNAAWGGWLHQGQICMAGSCVFVHESIAGEFTARLAHKARNLPVGDPASGQCALGPVINERQAARVRAMLADTLQAGARLEAGGAGEGLMIPATLVSGVKPGMRTFDEETFGPVISVISFRDDADALALANRHHGALACAVHSRSVGRAMAIARRLNAGMVHVNDQTVNDDVVNPFGGPGVAGAGSSVAGPADIDEYTRWQWLTVREEPPAYPF